MSSGSVLARRSVGSAGLWFYAASASAPMTVLAGGIVATIAGTGVLGVPLAFVVLTAALWLLSIGYTAMVRVLPHTAPFYALPAQGLGRPVGVATGLIALLSYTAMEIALLALIGVELAGHVPGRWWLWSAVAWAVVLLLGGLRVDLSASLLALFLLAEVTVIVVFDLVFLTHPAGGHLSLTPWHPDRLVVNGVGGVLALSVAAFVGYESPAAYGEEARSRRSPGRATLGAVLILGPFYAISAWALTASVGPDQVVAATRVDADLPFTVLTQTMGALGPLIAGLGQLLLVTSIFAAILSFHSTAARYSFALGRARILPARLARTGDGERVVRRDAPVAASILQSTLTAGIVTVAMLTGLDPYTRMFTWLATLAAIGVLVLLVMVALAAICWFPRDHRRQRREGLGSVRDGLTVWSTRIAPVAGLLVGLAVTGIATWNLNTLLGIAAGSALVWVIPAVIGITGMVGVVRAWVLYKGDPATYLRIGRDREHELAVPDQRLNHLLRPAVTAGPDRASDLGSRWSS